MEELYIDEEEFDAYNNIISEIDTAIEERLSKILSILDTACTAVSEGNFHNNLVTYKEVLSTMQGRLNEFTLKIQSDSTKFCNEIAEIDKLGF